MGPFKLCTVWSLVRRNKAIDSGAGVRPVSPRLIRLFRAGLCVETETHLILSLLYKHLIGNVFHIISCLLLKCQAYLSQTIGVGTHGFEPLG
jgi:hypothetical protein